MMSVVLELPPSASCAQRTTLSVCGGGARGGAAAGSGGAAMRWHLQHAGELAVSVGHVRRSAVSQRVDDAAQRRQALRGGATRAVRRVASTAQRSAAQPAAVRD